MKKNLIKLIRGSWVGLKVPVTRELWGEDAEYGDQNTMDSATIFVDLSKMSVVGHEIPLDKDFCVSDFSKATHTIDVVIDGHQRTLLADKNLGQVLSAMCIGIQMLPDNFEESWKDIVDKFYPEEEA